jgi:hypothetical protein
MSDISPKLDQFAEWVKTEAGLVEHTAEHTLDELKQAFANGLMIIKEELHRNKQAVAGKSLSALVAPPVSETK